MDSGAPKIEERGRSRNDIQKTLKINQDKRIRYIHIVPQMSGDVSPRHNNIARPKARAATVVEAIIISVLVV